MLLTHAWIAFSPRFAMLINRVARKSAIVDELSVFLFSFFLPFRPCYFEKDGTGEKKMQVKKREKRGERARRRKNRGEEERKTGA